MAIIIEFPLNSCYPRQRPNAKRYWYELECWQVDDEDDSEPIAVGLDYADIVYVNILDEIEDDYEYCEYFGSLERLHEYVTNGGRQVDIVTRGDHEHEPASESLADLKAAATAATKRKRRSK